MEKKSPFILVDGSSYLYRAYFAPPHLTNSKGEATGAIFGVVNMLRSLLKEYKPERIAVVFDAKGPTFRDEMYDQYKANRQKMPDDLRSQIAPLYEVIQALGLPIISIEGVEADDVIGTLARQASQNKQSTLISTGDKDLAQLVNEHISLINTMTQTYLDPQGVEQKFGVKPEQMIDYLALVGDTSDNIPGLPGVGEKTAHALIHHIGGVDKIYENLDMIQHLSFRGAKTMKKKLIEHKDLLMLSRDLVTIKCDVDLQDDAQDLSRQPEDREKLIELYSTLEFRRLLDEQKRLGESNLPQPIPAESADTSYHCILTETDLNRWIEKIHQAPYVAIDTETTSLDYMKAELVGISWSIQAGHAAYIPLAHDYENAPKQITLDQVLQAIQPMLENPSILKVGQNIKYDRSIFKKYGIDVQGAVFDTMLESYVLNSTATRHNMNDLAYTYLNKKTVSFEDVAGKGAKQKTFNQIELEPAVHYACEDADITLQLHQHLWAELEKAPTLKKVYEQIEQPLIHILSKIERQGVLIDTESLKQQSEEITQVIEELESKAFELAGEHFNLSSTKQLQHIFFEKLNYPILKKTPKGAPSTAEEVLAELALDYPLPEVILQHRSLIKLKTTYIDKLPLMIHDASQRVHTNYHQAVTATGRLSSADPNLQNIPIRSEEGRRIRHAFIAPDDHVVLAADYSQVELRIMAHLSQDPNLLQAFAENKDIHKATAAEVFNVDFDQVTHEQRRRAKAVNFGLIYGMSAFGLSKQLDIPRHEAQLYMDTYFERYPGVLHYMERTRAQVAEQGFVETLFGRRLYLPEIHAKNQMRRAAAERAAINAPMQGTAADIIKLAMIAVEDWLTQHPHLGIKMLMQVHDELVFEVPKKHAQEAKKHLAELMSNAAKLDVPLLVDAQFGVSWEQAH